MRYLLSPARFALYHQSQGAHPGLQRKGNLRDIKTFDTKPGSLSYDVQHRTNPWYWGHGLNKYGDFVAILTFFMLLKQLKISQSLVLEKRYQTGAQTVHISYFPSQLPFWTLNTVPALARLTDVFPECILYSPPSSLSHLNVTRILRSNSFPTS